MANEILCNDERPSGAAAVAPGVATIPWAPGYQLLPCPFCGGQARFGQNDGDYASHHTWWVECGSCGVELNGTTDKGRTFDMWNRRDG